MAFFQQLASRYPDLRHRLLIARIEKSPERYVRQSVTSAGMVAAVLLIGALLLALGLELPLWIVPIVGVLAYLLAFSIVMRVVDVEIRKQAKEIDKDVLFAGRFLLIKLNTGEPLINALVEASKSYGVANKYFKEIVREIELGTHDILNGRIGEDRHPGRRQLPNRLRPQVHILVLDVVKHEPRGVIRGEAIQFQEPRDRVPVDDRRNPVQQRPHGRGEHTALGLRKTPRPVRGLPQLNEVRQYRLRHARLVPLEDLIGVDLALAPGRQQGKLVHQLTFPLRPMAI